ncbi:CU044_5270 family protein [Phytomonospora sp. NPDC050363]|uniref:CU044_5270 family protein n=1 Tax=Phytomonospora sp. NPDC050363 TaxID=3155642 RepID=UPI0033D561F8
MNDTPNKPTSNEHDELARLLPKPAGRDLPSESRSRLQEFVMNHIEQDRSATPAAPRRAPRRRLLLTAAALAAVAAVAVGVVVTTTGQDAPGTVGDTAGPHTGQPATGGNAFELAAAYALQSPYTAPTDDQWIYVKQQSLAVGAIAESKGQLPDVTTELWLSADGTKMASFNEEIGELDTWEQDNEYPWLCALPTDPAELLAVLREDVESPADGREEAPATGPDAEEDLDAAVFTRISVILDSHLLPPDVTAALWRAAGLVPGAKVSEETVEIDGREVIAAGRVQDGWRFDQLLLDPETHAYVGYRSVAVADHEYEGPDGAIHIEKDELQWATVRLAAGIVGKQGQTL